MNNPNQLKNLYKLAKDKKVGKLTICPSCGTEYVKASYQQVFCSTLSKTQCKDYYWNNVTPTKRNNTTRISPANAAYKKLIDERREERELEDDDMSWDAHKNTM